MMAFYQSMEPHNYCDVPAFAFLNGIPSFLGVGSSTYCYFLSNWHAEARYNISSVA